MQQWLRVIPNWLLNRLLWTFQGEPKVYETFWRAVVAIYRVLMRFYGMVRVDFSQPFSVKVPNVR